METIHEHHICQQIMEWREWLWQLLGSLCSIWLRGRGNWIWHYTVWWFTNQICLKQIPFYQKHLLQTWDLVSVHFPSGGRRTVEVCLSSKKKPTPQQIYSINLPENKSIPITVNLTVTTFHIIPWAKASVWTSNIQEHSVNLYNFLKLHSNLTLNLAHYIGHSLFLKLWLLVLLSCLSWGTY